MSNRYSFLALPFAFVGLSGMFAFSAMAYQYGTKPAPTGAATRTSQQGKASSLIDNAPAGKVFALDIYNQLPASEKQAWDKVLAQHRDTYILRLKQSGSSGEALARRAQELTQEIASQRQFAYTRAATIEQIRARSPGATGDQARLQIAELQLAKLILIKQALEDQLKQLYQLKPEPQETKSVVPVAQVTTPKNLTQPCGPAGVGQKAPAGAPADDLDGIRMGMTATQVKAILACLYPNEKIEESSSANQVYLEILPVHPINGGRENMSVLLAGRPGSERVFRVRKDVRLSPPAPVAQFVATLTAKYGSFSTLPSSYSSSAGIIAHDVEPKSLAAATPSFPAWPERCWANAISENSPNSKDVGCGLTIVYYSGAQQQLANGYKLVVTDLREAAKALAEAQDARLKKDQAMRPVPPPKALAQDISPARARAHLEAVNIWKTCLYSRLRSQFECPDEVRCIALDPEHKKPPVCRSDGGYVRH